MLSVGFACKYFHCTTCASSTNLVFGKIDMFRDLIFTVIPYVTLGRVLFLLPLMYFIWGKLFSS